MHEQQSKAAVQEHHAADGVIETAHLVTVIRDDARHGMRLGKLVVLAANEYAFGAAVSLTAICDEALIEMVERYVLEHVGTQARETKTPPG